MGTSFINITWRNNAHGMRNYLAVPIPPAPLVFPAVIIENVPAVQWYHEEVVARAEALFRSEGYEVTTGVMGAHKMGCPKGATAFLRVPQEEARPSGRARFP